MTAPTGPRETLRPDGYIGTGVLATEVEVRLMREAFSMPVMRIGGHWPKEPWLVVHEYAIRHGLPELVGHYGCDFSRREFIRERDAVLAESAKGGA